MDGRLLVVIPVYGHHEMTHELIGDLVRESALADIVVVDNGGDYPGTGVERVLRPGRNLGWAEGTNRGTTEGRRPEHSAFVWLNNDTRLSRDFLAGLVRAWRATGAGLVGPFYDCYWIHQRLSPPVPVPEYWPVEEHHAVPFLDGTCVLVPVSTVDAIGLLDAATFGPIGWGAEVDYCLRARRAGLDPIATRLSYLHHEKSVTGAALFEGGLAGYAGVGYPVLEAGMIRKWGEDWRAIAGIDPRSAQTMPPRPASRIRVKRPALLRAGRAHAARSKRRSGPRP